MFVQADGLLGLAPGDSYGLLEQLKTNKLIDKRIVGLGPNKIRLGGWDETEYNSSSSSEMVWFDTMTRFSWKVQL